MRLSHLFGRTLRQAPAEAETDSHKLLLRGGFVRQAGAGIYSYLPLGWRVLRKVADILRDEMDRIGGQEMLMPVLNPADLWKESGRWQAIGQELIRFQDRAERELVLAMTHEEIITDIARRDVQSYRQLPFMAYHIQTKVRDEARPRGGLVRLREFIMKDAYSFHPDDAGLDSYYPMIYQAYVNIFRRCGLEPLPVEADPGLIGGTGSHEFVLPTPVGEDTIIRCTSCSYAANVEKAIALKQLPDTTITDAIQPIVEVATPGARTIDGLVTFFNLPAKCFLKSVFYSLDGQIVVAAIRGDLDVNEAKLARALQSTNFCLASDEELQSAGIVAGYASPVGLRGIRTIVDDSVPSHVFVAGANKLDTHWRNVSPSRDFAADLVTDIAVAEHGHRCAECGAELESVRGIELGHTFKLGTKYSGAMHANYLGPDGREQSLVMGCYGIGLDRLIAAVVERHHDEFGIIWPESIAPYQIYLCALGLDRPEVAQAAEDLYSRLLASGREVLFDDRGEPPGVKFNDADLIGIPLRLTISPRTLKSDSIELKRRDQKEFQLSKLADLDNL